MKFRHFNNILTVTLIFAIEICTTAGRVNSNKYTAFSDNSLSSIIPQYWSKLSTAIDKTIEKQPRGPVNFLLASSSSRDEQINSLSDKVKIVNNLTMTDLKQLFHASSTPIPSTSIKNGQVDDKKTVRPHQLAGAPVTDSKIRRRTGRLPTAQRPSLQQLAAEAWQLLKELLWGMFNGEAVTLFSRSCPPNTRRNSQPHNQALITLQKLWKRLPVEKFTLDMLNYLLPPRKSPHQNANSNSSQVPQQLRVMVMVAGDAAQTWLRNQLTERDELMAGRLLDKTQRRMLTAVNWWIPILTPMKATPTDRNIAAIRAKQQANTCLPLTPDRSLRRLLYASALSTLIRSLTPREIDVKRVLNYETPHLDTILCRLPLLWLIAGKCSAL